MMEKNLDGGFMMQELAAYYPDEQMEEASVEKLMFLLCDSAVRFADEAKSCIDTQNRRERCEAFDRLKKTLFTLEKALKKEETSEICENQLTLHEECFDKITQARIYLMLEPLEEAKSILEKMRDTWGAVLDS